MNIKEVINIDTTYKKMVYDNFCEYSKRVKDFDVTLNNFKTYVEQVAFYIDEYEQEEYFNLYNQLTATV